jgi:hypothetical protein
MTPSPVFSVDEESEYWSYIYAGKMMSIRKLQAAENTPLERKKSII